MESDRKYRQRGYQESYAEEKRTPAEKPRRREEPGPRSPQMPGTREVSRCAGCGALLPSVMQPLGQCPQCGFELHSCRQCAHFDPASRFECTQPIPERIPAKDARNDCGYFALRARVEREASSTNQRPEDARRAFENLFKK